jgi:hypothetical protein
MRHLSGRLLAAAAVVPITVFASAAPAGAQESFAQPAQAAASWLVAQSDGTSWNGGDISTTLDAVIAMEAARVGGDQVEATLEWLNNPDTLSSYVFTTADGAEPTLNVGGAGKVMYAVATAGGDPTNFGGIKLADEVTASQTETGSYGDGTALASAWAVLGLSRTDEPAGEEAAAGLAAMQCPDGGFNYLDLDGGDDCVSDPDTTGLTASALATLGGDAAEASLTAAVDWLESVQAEEGGVGGEFGVNANSTAMAAQAFLAAGRADAAERAVAFLLELQYDCTGAEPGAFMYTDPEGGDYVEITRLLATAQAIVPVAGQNLADLDATDIEADVPGNGCESAAAGDETTGTVGDEGSAAWLPWAIGAAVVVLAALAIGIAMKNRRGGEDTAGAEAGAVATADEKDESASPSTEDESKGGSGEDPDGAEKP